MINHHFNRHIINRANIIHIISMVANINTHTSLNDANQQQRRRRQRFTRDFICDRERAVLWSVNALLTRTLAPMMMTICVCAACLEYMNVSNQNLSAVVWTWAHKRKHHIRFYTKVSTERRHPAVCANALACGDNRDRAHIKQRVSIIKYTRLQMPGYIILYQHICRIKPEQSHTHNRVGVRIYDI